MPSAQYPIFLEPDTLLPVRPRARQRLTPSPRWEPGPALVPLLVAAPALLVAGILAAQSAPVAFQLISGLNVLAALHELRWAIVAAVLGIVGATFSMLLLAGHRTRRPGSGRAWASQHLEREVWARQSWGSRPMDPVIVVRRQGYTMPAITPLPSWDAAEVLPPHPLARQPRQTRKNTASPAPRRQARDRATRKLSESRVYMPLLPMPA